MVATYPIFVFFLLKGLSYIWKRSQTEDSPHLPEDIIFNILTWLPGEKVHKLRCVCKSWSTIITSSSFIEAHSRRSIPGLLIISEGVSNPRSPPIRTTIVKMQEGSKSMLRTLTVEPRTAWSSCNGLVLVGGFVMNYCEPFVANPVTKWLMKLPPTTQSAEHLFDHVLGMTFITSTRKYKVVHLFNGMESKKLLGCEILTVGDDIWRLVNSSATSVEQVFPNRDIVFIGDVAHWWVFEIDRASFSYIKYVHSLDLIEEKLYQTVCPNSHHGVPALLEIGGLLSVVTNVDGHSTLFEVLALKDLCKGIWVKQFRIEIESVNGSVSAVATLERGQVIISRRRSWPFYYYAYNHRLKQTVSLDFESTNVSARVFRHIDSLSTLVL